MTEQQKKQLKKKLGFEAWRDRAFSIIVPTVLIYLLVSQGHSQQIKLIAIILLVGFATGQAATVIRSLANSFAQGIINSNGQDDRNKTDDRDRSRDRSEDDRPE